VKTFTIGIPGGSLFVYEWGSAGDPPVVYWDGLGGCGLHANEIAPVLAEKYRLRVIAPDAPGHGRSPALPPDSFRPSLMAEVGANLLSELGVASAAFVGFSWGGRIGCSFAARFPDRTTSLSLIEGGHLRSPEIDGDDAADLEACMVDARLETEEDSFESWYAYFAFERDSLGRWTPALAETHRAVMREENGRVVPILEAEVLGAIKHGSRREPVTETYPLIAAAHVPVLLLTAPGPRVRRRRCSGCRLPVSPSEGTGRVDTRRDPRSCVLRPRSGRRACGRLRRRAPVEPWPGSGPGHG
jgi:pimeloyl-ACP methyl ester carboxylesterase